MKKLTVCAGLLTLMMGSASAAEQKSIDDSFAPFIPKKPESPMTFPVQEGGAALALIYPTKDNQILSASTDQPESVSINRVGPALLVEVHQPAVCGTISVVTTAGDRSFEFCSSTTAGTFRSELIFAHQINELAKSARPCLAA
jgi:hypothetical protein